MKKLVKLFALVAVMLVCGQSMAQTRGVMSLGASFPMKDYAEFDGFDDFALMSHDEEDGGAGIGFNAGLKWYFNVGVKGLGVMLSIDGLYNGPSAALKTAYRDSEIEMSGILVSGSYKYTSTPKYINIPAMLGLNYIYHFNPNFGLFVEAGAGGNLRIITDMATVAKQDVVLVGETKTSIVNHYDKAFSFAWQAGIGFEVAKNLVVGCSFYDLGKGAVNMTENKKVTIGSGSPTETTDYKTLGTVHPVMVLGRIGFSF